MELTLRSDSIALPDLTRRVVAGQVLFTAGHVLSTGGFLFYFANEFRPAALLLALLQCTPEVAESAGILVRPIVARLGGRKRTWIAALLLARLIALGVPLTAFPAIRSAAFQPVWIIIASVGLWYVCQGIAYIAYLSWLSDLVPDHNWGRFFARRNTAILLVMLTVPVLAGTVRSRWISGLAGDAQLISYVAIFAAGGLLVLASILPMLGVPNARMRSPARAAASWSLLSDCLSRPPFRLLLIYSWWLSFAQGLTQAAFFKYQVDVLKIPVTTYYLMSSLMLGLQLPLTLWAGRLSDRYGDKRPLATSTFAVSLAMIFWLLAKPSTWWLLFGAYAVWGLFAVVNLCGQNLALRLAPPSDNMLHLSLFRQFGGLLSGVAGLIGGFWLDHLLSAAPNTNDAFMPGPYQMLFAVSFLGRSSAAIWLLLIPSIPPSDKNGPS